MNSSPPAHPYFDLHHRVNDDEIDAQQHVHNLRYLQWSLWAAGKHTEAIGWDAKHALNQGVGWVVREHSIQYRVAAVAGDEVVIRTWVSDLQRFASRRKYIIFRPSDRAVLAKIETRWVFVDLTRHKVMSIPQEARESLTVLDAAPALPWEHASDI